MKLGRLIRELRFEKGLTQNQLAAELSTTQDSISLWELGKSKPDIDYVVKLALFFNVSTDYLLGLQDFR